MRLALFLCTLAFATAAAAQPAPAPAPSQAMRVSQLLGANWRPLGGVPASGETEAAFAAACEGAEAELAQLEASLPETLTSETVRMVRARRGFIIVPDTDPTHAFLFPNASLAGIASGLATIVIVNAAQGRITLHDAAGGDTEVQLGLSGRQAVMRILRSGGQAPLTYIGCVATAAGQ